MANNTKHNLPTLQFVACQWNDAWTEPAEAMTLSDAHLNHKPSVHITLGWVLFQNDSGISVANEYCTSDETYRGRTFIPISMLDTVTPINLTISRKKKVNAQ